MSGHQQGKINGGPDAQQLSREPGRWQPSSGPDQQQQSSGPGGPLPDEAAVARKVYAAYHLDGLDEALGGVVLMTVSALMLGYSTAPLALAPVLALVMIAVLRRRFIRPRIGYFVATGRHAAAPRPLALTSMLAIVALSIVCTYLVMVQTPAGGPLRVHPVLFSLVLGLTAVVMLFSVGLCTAVKRWYAWAGLAIVSMAIAWLAGHDIMWGLLASGAVLLLAGVALFIACIAAHPLGGGAQPADAAPGGGRAALLNPPDSPELAALRSKALRPYHEDGVEDILVAVNLFLCCAVLTHPIPSGISWIAFMPLYVIMIRRHVTYPRVGFFRPARRSAASQAGLWIIGGCAAVAVACVAVLAYALRHPAVSSYAGCPPLLFEGLLELALTVLLVAMGVYSEQRRWYIYAAAFAALLLVMRITGGSLVDTLASAALGIGIAALILLLRFIYRYPVLAARHEDGAAELGSGQ